MASAPWLSIRLFAGHGSTFGHLGSLAFGCDSITPLLHGRIIHRVEVGFAHLLQCLEITFLLWLHLSNGQAGGSLLANESTEAGLGLDNAVWDATSLAQRWQPHDNLNGIHIVSDNNQVGFLLLDKLGHVIDAHLDGHWLLISWGLACGLSLGSLGETLGLLRLALRLKRVEQTEELSSLTLVECLLELVDCWGNLDALVQDPAGALDANVLWPLDETGQIAGWADVATDAESAGLLLDDVGRELDLGRSLFRHL